MFFSRKETGLCLNVNSCAADATLTMSIFNSPLLPPTSHLPPIRQISSKEIGDLDNAIAYLREIYNPEVRGSRRRKTRSRHSGNIVQPMTSTLQSPDIANCNRTSELTIDDLRGDGFERSYAIRWLTALISQLGSDQYVAPSLEMKENTMQNAASLLAVCAGAASAGILTRNFTFYLRPSDIAIMEEKPIHVKLTDIPLDNRDYGSVGTQTWGGACILSDMISENPAAFGLHIERVQSTNGKQNLRILELGAGTGLVSLVVGQLIQVSLASSSDRGLTKESPLIDIVATDYYPRVLENLRTNIKTNFSSPLVNIIAHPLDWSRSVDLRNRPPPFDHPFDLILGADIIYEVDHAAWIRSCLVHLLRKPSSSGDSSIPEPLFHLIIPLRKTHQVESSTIENVFRVEESDSPSLQIVYRDTLPCETENGEDVEYAYYKIGWR